MSAIPLASDYVLEPIPEEDVSEEVQQLILVKPEESTPWTYEEKRKCICGSIGAVIALVSLVLIVYVWYVFVTKYG